MTKRKASAGRRAQQRASKSRRAGDDPLYGFRVWVRQSVLLNLLCFKGLLPDDFEQPDEDAPRGVRRAYDRQLQSKARTYLENALALECDDLAADIAAYVERREQELVRRHVATDRRQISSRLANLKLDPARSAALAPLAGRAGQAPEGDLQ